MAEMVKTEEILGQKWDKCVLDAGIKMSSGLAIGKLFPKKEKKKIFLKRFLPDSDTSIALQKNLSNLR